MAAIRLEDLHKTWPNGQTAVRGVDLEVGDGELVVLVGPSGCGKSTTLRLVAGLESPTRGRIHLGGRDVTRLPPQRRDLAMVFQTYALYPHMRVAENLGFGLRMRGVARDARTRRVAEVARLLGLETLLERRPAELSGGQRQRVALGRAIVREPQAFLLDEPLSNLDARLRLRTRTELSRLHRRLGATMLYVTHDQEEAMTLGDRVAVMRDGRLQQVAPPLEVYERPANVFVAGFIGSPAMNILSGRLLCGAQGARLVVPGIAARLRLDGPVPEACEEIQLGVRAHDVELMPAASRAEGGGAPGAVDAAGRVDVVEALGSTCLVHVELEGGAEVGVSTAADRSPASGARVALRLRRERLHVFDAATGARLAARVA